MGTGSWIINVGVSEVEKQAAKAKEYA